MGVLFMTLLKKVRITHQLEKEKLIKENRKLQDEISMLKTKQIEEMTAVKERSRLERMNLMNANLALQEVFAVLKTKELEDELEKDELSKDNQKLKDQVSLLETSLTKAKFDLQHCQRTSFREQFILKIKNEDALRKKKIYKRKVVKLQEYTDHLQRSLAAERKKSRGIEGNKGEERNEGSMGTTKAEDPEMTKKSRGIEGNKGEGRNEGSMGTIKAEEPEMTGSRSMKRKRVESISNLNAPVSKVPKSSKLLKELEILEKSVGFLEPIFNPCTIGPYTRSMARRKMSNQIQTQNMDKQKTEVMESKTRKRKSDEEYDAPRFPTSVLKAPKLENAFQCTA